MANGSTDRVRERTRASASLLTALATLWLLAGPAMAVSEVVDLRIGAHEDFTRVVFELDRPTGYRIERSSSTAGGQELVVSLDATSIPRKVHSSQKSLIGLVRITPEGDGSVARIQLTQEGLSLKEMILANPPRIVLDVLSPTRTAASKPAPEKKKPAAPAPKPKASAPAEKPPAPSEPVETARAGSGSAPSAATTPPEKQEPSGTSTRTAAKSGTADQPAAATPPKPESLLADTSAGGAKPPVDRRAGAPPPSVAAEPSEGGMATIGMESTGSGDAAPPTPAERMARRTAVPAAPPPTAEPDSGMGMGTLGLAIVGLVVLGGGFVLMRRRRAGAIEEDDEGVEVGGIDDDNPFAGLGKATSDRSGGAETPAGPGGEFDLAGIEEEEKEAAPVDGPLGGSTGPAAAATDSLIQTMAQDTGPVGAGLAGGEQLGEEEVMRMMREFERRIASLESRLDEVVDARERLERQVAAQTEELRVQRAAIARTQRAVRNMNRPDDEGPTEPAIREP
jgi:hypothetical protein